MSGYFTWSGYELDAQDLTRRVHEAADKAERVHRVRAGRVRAARAAGPPQARWAARDSGDLPQCETPQPLTAGRRRAAMRTVARHARDRTDLEQLLDALGLQEAANAVRRAGRIGGRR